MNSKSFLKTLVIFFFIASITVAVSAQENIKPKNIIVLIGDGMAAPQITSGLFFHKKLAVEKFKVLGLHKTWSANKIVTDSAAGGTALACGVKTNNGMVGMTPDKTPQKSALELAKANGKATGIVVTVVVPHATPAAFTAHVDSRYKYDEIAEQQTNLGLDLIVGGGLRHFLPDFLPGGKRKDGKNLISQLRMSMPVVQSFDAFMKLGKTKKAAALLAPKALPHASKRDYNLGQLTKKSIEILNRNENGFFLMVEGSQIDYAGHDNDHKRVLSELADFDKAVAEAYEFAQKDKNTLVIVTGDHETGGLTLIGKKHKRSQKPDRNFSSDYHSAVVVPVFAFGPAAQKFAGIQDNTDVGKKLKELAK
jgi:alkaline phosphatase